MDILITNILNRMHGKADLNLLKQALYICLNDYDIQPKKYELRIENDRWMQLLEMFLERKNLRANQIRL